MREPTDEEREAIQAYIDSISIDTGICLFADYKLKEGDKMEKDTNNEDYIRRSDVGLTDFEILMCDGDYKKALIMLLEKIEKAPSVNLKELVK